MLKEGNFKISFLKNKRRVVERVCQQQIREGAESQEQVEYDWEMEMTDSLQRQWQGVLLHFEYI